jgi:hypothetical protein
MRAAAGALLSAVALMGTAGCQGTDVQAPVGTPTPTHATCTTEDQDGWCTWKGTYRYWDSRSEADRQCAATDQFAVVEDGYVYCDG